MRINSIALVFTLLGLVLPSHAGSDGVPQVRFELSPASFREADTLIASAIISIPPGWHVYSNKPLDKMRKPCRASVEGVGIRGLEASFPAADTSSTLS